MSATVRGDAYELVPAGVVASMSIVSGTLNAPFGCNAAGGKATIGPTMITFAFLPSTMNACPEPASAVGAERTMQRVLVGTVRFRLSAGQLTLTRADGTGVALTDAGAASSPTIVPSAAAIPSALVRRTWQVTSIRLPGHSAGPTQFAELGISADGTVALRSSCANGSATVNAARDTLAFADVQLLIPPCPPGSLSHRSAAAQDVFVSWNQLLTRPVRYTVGGGILTLTCADGTVLTLRLSP